ncbi:MAG: fatty acid desaturase [Myxococcales bacterium]|nr:fatty acid desaturase [Myxococcales bacterium]
MGHSVTPQPNPPTTVARRLRSLVGSVPLVDVPTAAIVVLMIAGTPLLVWGTHRGHVPWWAAFLAGTYLMNLSFTAWHEPAHGTFSSSRRLNLIVGWLSSFASVYPGYFARRREHLVHHKFEGTQGKDPVYPRIQTTFFGFPLRIMQQMFKPDPLDVPETFHPITPGQRLSDMISNLLVLGVLGVAIALGFWRALLVAWIVPRFFVVMIHAYYICFFPHHIEDGGYRVYRIRRDGILLKLLTVNQHMHGIHHKWPWIPWHKYQLVRRELGDELYNEDIEEVGRPFEATTSGGTQSR